MLFNIIRFFIIVSAVTLHKILVINEGTINEFFGIVILLILFGIGLYATFYIIVLAFFENIKEKSILAHFFFLPLYLSPFGALGFGLYYHFIPTTEDPLAAFFSPLAAGVLIAMYDCYKEVFKKENNDEPNTEYDYKAFEINKSVINNASDNNQKAEKSVINNSSDNNQKSEKLFPYEVFRNDVTKIRKENFNLRKGFALTEATQIMKSIAYLIKLNCYIVNNETIKFSLKSNEQIDWVWGLCSELEEIKGLSFYNEERQKIYIKECLGRIFGSEKARSYYAYNWQSEAYEKGKKASEIYLKKQGYFKEDLMEKQLKDLLMPNSFTKKELNDLKSSFSLLRSFDEIASF